MNFTRPLFFFLLLIVICPSGYACSCDLPPHARKQLENATAVFSGKVVDIKKTIHEGRFESVILTVTFKVDHRWKGGLDLKAVLRESGGCRYGFKLGERYLVYAFGDGQLSTGYCNRTKPLKKSAGDLKELGPPLPKSKT